jgi:hypothetical protein
MAYPTFGPVVDALAVFDDGGGAALYAGGRFTTAGGVAATYVAKWDGAGWSAVGSSLSSEVFALTVFDDGGGAALYAGGAFTTAGKMAVNRVAKWDGSSWSALGSGLSGSVRALAPFQEGSSNPALFVGGEFQCAPVLRDAHLARWGCLASLGTPPRARVR